MSRKIGLGDTHFDPDIDGDIDFDFFGGDTVGGVTVASAPSTSSSTLSHTSPTSQSNSRYENSQDQCLKQHHTEGGKIVDTVSCSTNTKCMNTVSTAATTEKNMECKEEQPLRTSEPPLFSCSRPPSIESSITSRQSSLENTTQTLESPQDEDTTEDEVARLKSDSISSDSDSISDIYSLTDDDEDEEDSFELDSDITDVSPLSSSNVSPLPESPKRSPEPKNAQPSPRSDLRKRFLKGELSKASADPTRRNALSSSNRRSSPKLASGPPPGMSTGSCPSLTGDKDTVDLKVLTKAILELEEERKKEWPPAQRAQCLQSRASSGHAKPYVRSRKNMTFTNDEVRRIDQENKRLLRRIIDAQKPRKPSSTHSLPQTGRVASATINRFKETKKIESENLALLKRLQAAKPTRELSRQYLLGSMGKEGLGASQGGNGNLLNGNKGSLMTGHTFSPLSTSAGARVGHGGGGRVGGRYHSAGSLPKLPEILKSKRSLFKNISGQVSSASSTTNNGSITSAP